MARNAVDITERANESQVRATWSTGGRTTPVEDWAKATTSAYRTGPTRGTRETARPKPSARDASATDSVAPRELTCRAYSR